jgi:hypothetical protein
VLLEVVDMSLPSLLLITRDVRGNTLMVFSTAAAVIKGKDKSTRELQRSSSHSKKINKISD